MNKRLLLLFSTACMIGLLAVSSGFGENSSFDFKSLIGEWEGQGDILVPMTGLRMDVDGTAKFSLDSASGRIKSAIISEKFMFTYSDSGFVTHNPKTDSVSWEIWDNFGKHAIYHGVVSDGKLVGTRKGKRGTYNVLVDQVGPDRIDFRLTLTRKDSSKVSLAALKLSRVKE